MAAISITIGGTALPVGDLVSCRRSDELLWSDGTGRSASTGALCGSVVAEKFTYELRWGVIDQTTFNSIKSILPAAGSGTKSIVVKVNNVTVASSTIYRSNIESEMVEGCAGYYKDVTVSLIEV